MSPLVESKSNDVGASLRSDHLAVVFDLARQFKRESALTPTALQLYWTLYLGVLSHWTKDKSSKQEDTLALLDQSMTMFTNWIESQTDDPSSN